MFLYFSVCACSFFLKLFVLLHLYMHSGSVNSVHHNCRMCDIVVKLRPAVLRCDEMSDDFPDSPEI